MKAWAWGRFCLFGATFTFAQCHLGSERSVSPGKHRVKLMCVYSTVVFITSFLLSFC